MTGALVALLVQAGLPVVAYDVTCGPRCVQLSVEASLPAAIGARLSIDGGMGPFVRGAEYEEDGRWLRATVRGDEVLAAGCRQRPCRLRYRLELADAARQLKESARAIGQAGIVAGPPASFLLRPSRPEGGERFRLKVTAPANTRFATGLFEGGKAGVYEGALSDLAEGPYSAFGVFASASVQAAGRPIEIAIAPSLAARRGEIVAWVEAAARDVAAFYGRAPVPRALVIVLAGRRPAVSFGSTVGGGGASIVIYLPPAVPPLAKDAVLVHEMIHFGIPTVPRRHRWLEEGLATYLEPMVRAAGGRQSASEAWGILLDGLPRALPQSPAPGLDQSRTWASTYWGGALYALLADVAIRERTGNRKGLRDALRAIQARGGSIAVRWPLERVLAEGDAATGTAAMSELHARMSRRIEVDLPDVWKRLGVARRDGAVVFDDGAPLAKVRRGIAEGAKGRR
jgi:hypothetical protein